MLFGLGVWTNMYSRLVASVATAFRNLLQTEEEAGNTNVFYNPADLTSLRVNTDGSGGVPVVGDPVGVMLDTSQFGGKTAEDYLAGATELVTNGTFDSDISGWTGSGWSFNSGAAQSSGASVALSQSLSLTDGAYYLVSFLNVSGTDPLEIRFGGNPRVTSGVITPSVGVTYSFVLQANSNSDSIQIARTAATLGNSVDNISVKELPGHHAIAPADSARLLFCLQQAIKRRQ